MNLQNNSNRQNKNLQDVLKKWDEKILPHLPENLEELALKTDALQRKRGLRSATDLLKILLIYACQKISFRMLAAAVCALGISAVSDTSLRKHFSKVSSFLHEMLHSMLSSFLKEPDISAYGKIKNVLLVDASVIRQDGKKQEQQRIHTCYSLNKNRICEIKVTDQHTAEFLRHFSFKKDDLIMADAEYGTANNYIYAQEQQADVILRITPKNFCIYDADGNKISFIEKLKEAEKNHTEIMDISGFCKYKTKTASRKQNYITEETLFCAGWMVVITSLGTEYCVEEILHLYRSRWQVELLLKRFKQNFSITTLKAGNINYAETEVPLWLIIWVISERQSFLAECFLKEKNETADYSVYEKCKLAFLQIREILCLSWSQFIDITDKKYLRYLSKRKRYRVNKNDEFHTIILPGLLA